MFEKWHYPQSQWFEKLVFASAGTKIGLAKKNLCVILTSLIHKVISDFLIGLPDIYLLSSKSEQVFDNIISGGGVCVCV